MKESAWWMLYGVTLVVFGWVLVDQHREAQRAVTSWREAAATCWFTRPVTAHTSWHLADVDTVHFADGRSATERTYLSVDE